MVTTEDPVGHQQGIMEGGFGIVGVGKRSQTAGVGTAFLTRAQETVQCKGSNR